MMDASVKSVAETVSVRDRSNLGRNGNVWPAAHPNLGGVHNTRKPLAGWNKRHNGLKQLD